MIKALDSLPTNYKKSIIKKWIKEIRVIDDKINITLNLLGNNQMSLPDMARLTHKYANSKP